MSKRKSLAPSYFNLEIICRLFLYEEMGSEKCIRRQSTAYSLAKARSNLGGKNRGLFWMTNLAILTHQQSDVNSSDITDIMEDCPVHYPKQSGVASASIRMWHLGS
jgi:hypothetical protein